MAIPSWHASFAWSGVLLCLALALRADAVQLSQLLGRTDYPWYPLEIQVYPDDTRLLSATSTYPVAELELHPIVTLDESIPNFSESILVTRIHPNNTVIWAAALSSFDTVSSVVTAILPDGHSFVTGSIASSVPPTRLSIIKFSPNGKKVWTRIINAHPWNIDNDSPKRYFAFAHPDKLLLVASRGAATQSQTFAVLRFETSTGRFVDAIPFATFNHTTSTSLSNKNYASSADGMLFCAVFHIENSSSDAETLIVKCTNFILGYTITRQMFGLIPRTTIFNTHAVMENSSDKYDTSTPILSLVYERVSNFSYSAPEGESEAEHQLFVHRLSTSTLADVGWASEHEAFSSAPLTVTITPPFYANRALALFPPAYSERSNSLAIPFSTNINILSFSQPKEGDNVTAQGDRNEYIWPAVDWILFISRQNKISAQLLKSDPRVRPVADKLNHMIRTDFEYSPDEKAVVAYGFLQRIEGGGEIESGPLFTHNVPSPFAGDHGMKGGPMPLPSSDGSEPQSSDDLDLESFADGSPESSAEASAEASEEASAESNIDPSPEAILDLLRGIELEAYY